MKIIRALRLPVALLFLALSGCTLCPPPADKSAQQLLIVAAMSGGQAPLMRKLSLYSNGAFVYGYVGGKLRCGRLSPGVMDEIESRFDAISLGELESSEGWGMDQAQLILELNNEQYIFLMTEVPKEVTELVGLVDRSMRARLGKQYEDFLEGSS
jgi:hypothetical protein